MLQAAMMMPRQNRISELLEGKGWSVYKFAKVLGMPYHNVKRIATSDKIPDGTEYKTLLAFSKALEVRIDDLELKSDE